MGCSRREERPEHNADWEGTLRGDTVLAGDFNAHSQRWNPHVTTQINQAWKT